jgi:hypothetical protein
MGLFSMWRFARGVSLMVAILLCLGVFLFPLPAPGSEVTSALVVANSPRVDQGETGNGHPLDGSYLLVPAEEAEDADKDPLNADLLTMLLLIAPSFGVTVGWLNTNAQRHGALCYLGVVRPSWASACEDLLSLGVFRL